MLRFSKLMSRDMGLIGRSQYLPLAQFTKSRSVDSLGPFCLASLETGFVMASMLPATTGAPRIRTTDMSRWIRVPARLFESPRHSGATDEGVTPRLLLMGLPGVVGGGKPTELPPDSPGPARWNRHGESSTDKEGARTFRTS